jgi:hypothetical protein
MNIEINNSVVTKDGEEIGTILGDTCHLKDKVGPTVKGAIKRASGLERVYFIVGGVGEPKDLAEDLPSLADMSDDDLAAEMKRRGLIQDAPAVVESPAIVQPAVVERDLSAIDRLHKLADEGKIPTPPAKHPAMGDKTPEYVAWFKAHATPAEIAARYPDNRRVPASIAEFAKAQAKIYDKLPGEKKDTGKEFDFTDKAE